MTDLPRALGVATEILPLRAPFAINGRTFLDIPVVVATIGDGARSGRGEAAGVYYRSDDVDSMVAQIETCRGEIERGVSRDDLRRLLPPGGARNALDCALWELEAQRAGTTVWKLANCEAPRPLVTTFTIGADKASVMAQAARAMPAARMIKLKLTQDLAENIERVRAVRAARPDVWLGVDANQGLTPDTFEALLPSLVQCAVRLIEQPFALDRDRDLDGIKSPIPIAADESLHDLDDLRALADGFQIINIKLDKCGGLTEGLAMAREARRMGLGVMVGNMIGSSLAMAPAFILGQVCDIVDLDGVTFLCADRSPGIDYSDGMAWCPEAVWGGTSAGHAGNGQ